MANISFYLFEQSPERQVESACRLCRICISAQLPEQSDWIVFNFNDQALEQFEKFSHIIEIIENNESAKQQGREKFKQYRRLGVEARTFKL